MSTPPVDPFIRQELETLFVSIRSLSPEKSQFEKSNISEERIDGLRQQIFKMLMDSDQRFKPYTLDLCQLVRHINEVDTARSEHEKMTASHSKTQGTNTLSEKVVYLKEFAAKIFKSAPPSEEELELESMGGVSSAKYNTLENSLTHGPYHVADRSELEVYFKANSDKKFAFLDPLDNYSLPGTFFVAIKDKGSTSLKEYELLLPYPGFGRKDIHLKLGNETVHFTSLAALTDYLNKYH